MTFTNPALPKILRRSVFDDPPANTEAGEWVKMFDPPNVSPLTPELMSPTNPVPEIMAAAGLASVSKPHTVQVDLLNKLTITTWDGLKNLLFFTIVIPDLKAPFNGPQYPAATLRVPRGAIFHGKTKGHGPPPHTVHWHGIEPTALNDGVGHCSMEIGDYTYQWQPNFIGSYFYHCHRNTVQHFEFGLFGDLLIETPDTFFASIASTNPDGTVVLNNIPIGNGRPEDGFPLGRRRIAANVAQVLLPNNSIADFRGTFPGSNNNPIDTADPLNQFATDPHAMTVPYDVEAIWVFDDRDSVWSDLAPDARATFPKHGSDPGVNDNFAGDAGGNVGAGDFFAFNDYHPDYFFVTGVPVIPPNPITPQIGEIAPNVVIPTALNSGIFGSQVSINAQVNQTILIRALDAAYCKTRITFPMDIVIIAWDGRALGVTPFTRYNKAHLLPANTPITTSTARRFDALVRTTQGMVNMSNPFVKVEFLNTRGASVNGNGDVTEDLVMTAKIPFNVGGAPGGAFAISGIVFAKGGNRPLKDIRITLTGAVTKTTLTARNGTYTFTDLANGDYTLTPSKGNFRFNPTSRTVTINNGDKNGQNFTRV